MTLKEALAESQLSQAERHYPFHLTDLRHGNSRYVKASGPDPCTAIVEIRGIGGIVRRYLMPPEYCDAFYGHADWEPIQAEKETA